ncbi:hypothetical protein Bca4012_061396 [Brassica carinata]|uniref:Uncharacterized protein n=1 Tax=Brassica carinata TaxID=52824 RepID=A0A8X7V6W1_BRACI|nr:hypothetical protein Bca52824_031697 [Brassica carinata]
MKSLQVGFGGHIDMSYKSSESLALLPLLQHFTTITEIVTGNLRSSVSHCMLVTVRTHRRLEIKGPIDGEYT